MPSLQISDENSKLSEQRLKIGTLLSDLKHHQLLHSREKHTASYRDRAQVDQQPVSPKNPKTPRQTTHVNTVYGAGGIHLL